MMLRLMCGTSEVNQLDLNVAGFVPDFLRRRFLVFSSLLLYGIAIVFISLAITAKVIATMSTIGFTLSENLL